MVFGGKIAPKPGYVICWLGSRFDSDVKVDSKSCLRYRSAASSSNMQDVSSGFLASFVSNKAARAS